MTQLSPLGARLRQDPLRRQLYFLILWCVNTSFGAGLVAQEDRYTMADFSNVEKIDVHAHVHTENSDFVSLAKHERFRFVNMAVWSSTAKENRDKHRTLFLQYDATPERIAPIVSFPLENWDAEDWPEQTIAYLEQQIARGAVGVKVWKNIGMELRDAQGNLVMIDDPKFDSVFKFLSDRDLVLIGHNGEPKNCWLPSEEMTTNNDRSYFEEHPKYHMFLHPELPTYEDQIAARDRMLRKNPKLTFLGAHLASLEWSTDEMARFLEQFPNASIGVAARMGQLQYQSQRDREKVIAFFEKYQNRILYGTDIGVGRESDVASRFEYVRQKWLRDWRYFNTEERVQVPELDEPVQGLGLPKQVVDKLYRGNAQALFPDSWRESGR